MPAIRDLYGVRQGFGRGFAIPSTTVAGDDPDGRMRGEPRLGGRRLTIGQKRDNPAPFQIADDAGVSMVSSPSPIIDAYDLERF
jgi:hypothetical protein